MDEIKIFDILHNEQSYYVNEIYLSLLKDKNQNTTKKIKHKISNLIIFIIQIIVSYIFMLINLPFTVNLDIEKEMAVARVPRERYKIERAKPNLEFLSDNIKEFDFTFYRIGSRFYRMKFLLFKYIPLCIQDYVEIHKILNKIDKDTYYNDILKELSMRIPHTVTHKYFLEKLLSNYKHEFVYTGAILERFALIAKSSCSKYGKKLVCYPHGLETTDMMPGGFAGDIFYSSSEKMAITLNSIYKTSSFQFDECINKRIYSTDAATNNRTEIVVYITQPLEEANSKKIIRSLSEFMMSNNKLLYIKVHPLEKESDYIFENTQFISNAENILKDNVCISISSTMLLEAIHNNSTSISVINLLDNKLKQSSIESVLFEDRIKKPNDLNEIFEIIRESGKI